MLLDPEIHLEVSCQLRNTDLGESAEPWRALQIATTKAWVRRDSTQSLVCGIGLLRNATPHSRKHRGR